MTKHTDRAVPNLPADDLRVAKVTGKVIPEVFVTVPLGTVSAIASVAIMRKWTAHARPVSA